MLSLLLLLLSPPVLAQDAPHTARALLVQEELPALDARLAQAERRREAREAWFAGTTDQLGAAFPHLAGAPLDDPAFLAGRRAELARASRTRASEGMQPPPDAEPDEITQWRQLHDQVLAAEDQVDQLELTLLGRLEVAWQQAPGLAEPEATTEALRLRDGLLAAEQAEDEARTVAWTTAQRRWTALQQAAVRSATVPGDTALARFLAEDVAAFDTPDPGLFVRLATAGPLAGLDEAAANAQRALDEQRLQAQLASFADDPPLPEDPEALQALVDAPPPEAPPAPEGLEDLAEQVQQARLAQHHRLVDRAQQALHAETEEEQGSTEADVEAARERARTAQERADEAANAEDEVSARLSAQIATFASEVVQLRELDIDHRNEARAEVEEQDKALADASSSRLEALGMGVLSRERQDKLDAAYANAAGVVKRTRELLAERRQTLALVSNEAGKRRAELPPESAAAAVQDPLRSQWRDAREELLSALEDREKGAARDLDEALALLGRAKELRRAIRSEASVDARSQDSRDFFGQAFSELTEWPLAVASSLRRVWRDRADLPRRLLDLNTWLTLLTRSTELMVLLLVWVVARARLETWWRDGLRALEGARYDREDTPLRRLVEWLDRNTTNGDWRHLDTPMGRASRQLLDVVVAGALLLVLHDPMPTLALFALLWQMRALYLALPELVLMAVNSPASPAPALLNASATLRQRAANTARVATAWLTVYRVSRHLTLDVMDADRLHTIVTTLTLGGGVLLALYGLTLWAQEVRSTVASAEQDNLTRVLSQPPPSRLLAAPLAAAGLTWLTGRWLARGASALVEQRAGLTWMGSLLARQRLKEAESLPEAHIGRPAAAAIRSARVDLPHQGAVQGLLAHHQQVRQGEGRGLTALVSDPGFSDTALLAAFDNAIEDDVTRIEVPPGLYQVDRALGWLAQAMEIEPDEALDTESLVRALMAQPSRVVFIRSTEHLFLRAVGGFSGLREVLRVLHATSAHHCWVCEVHGPAWDLLGGVRSAVDLDVFESVVKVDPIGAPKLASWLTEATHKAGYKASFEHLVADGMLGVDRERALERTESAWWRLLTDATGGNPGAALEAWLGSLRDAGDGVLAVSLLQAPSVAAIESLPDRDLFVLTALVIHRGLPVESLAHSLNLPLGTCRSACRALEAKGVLTELEDGRWRVVLRWFPPVVRHLRNKHFLHVR